MLRLVAAYAALLVALMAPAAAADVLTSVNESRLCRAMYKGRPAIDRDDLARAIVSSVANSMDYLDGANPGGVRNNAVDLTSQNGILSEPTYAIVHLDNHPFGPSVDLAKDKVAKTVADQIGLALDDDIFKLMDTGRYQTSDKKVTFVLQRNDIVGSPAEQADWKNPLLLFGGDSPLVVLCEDGPAPATPDVASPEKEKKGAPLADIVKLRGEVKDLSVRADKLKNASAAKIGYQRDGIKDVHTFGVNGVLGIGFENNSGSIGLTPYLSYEKHSATGHKDDVEKISPGFLFAYKIEEPAFAIHTRLEGSYMDDLEHNAEQGKLRLYIDPAIALGHGHGVLFGSYLTAIGPLQLRPDLTLLGDASYIFDRGSSKDLAGDKSYFGLGGEATLRARLGLGQPFSDFNLLVGARDLEIIHGLDQDRVFRWYGGVEYAPENFPYLGLSFTFTKGDNNDTFQKEELYEVGLTFRY
jgi:hypothetical protein